MPRNSDSFLDRMKKQTLAFWGGLCIFSGVFSGLAMQLMVDAADMSRAEERASQFGSAVAGGLFIIVGIVLLVLHLARGKRK